MRQLKPGIENPTQLPLAEAILSNSSARLVAFRPFERAGKLFTPHTASTRFSTFFDISSDSLRFTVDRKAAGPEANVFQLERHAHAWFLLSGQEKEQFYR